MLKKIIVMLPGDGIGPEVIRAAAGILRECAHEFGHHFDLPEYPLGGAAIDAKGVPLPAETLEACQKAKDRKSTRLNSSHPSISYAVFCLKKKSGARARPCHLDGGADRPALTR